MPATKPAPSPTSRTSPSCGRPSLACPSCEQAATAVAAIGIVLDGDQIASACPACGRRVRSSSWHGDDGLPSTYLLRFNRKGRAVEAAAWYGARGAIRSVPAIHPSHPHRHLWPTTFSTTTLARAILAHLIGLDIPAPIWEAFDFDIVLPLALASTDDASLSVETILRWLDHTGRHLAPALPTVPTDGGERS